MNLDSKQKKLLNDVARRSFRDMADQDYLAARLCFKNNLPFQFLWMSQQAIEKYIKCILLFNTTSTKGIGHDLQEGIKIINRIPYLNLDLSEKTIAFIKYIDEQGINRYFQKTMYTQGMELITLDRTIWEIRRYCKTLDYEFKKPDGETINALELELKAIKLSNELPPHKFNLIGGYLEKRLKDNQHGQGNLLAWKNFFFGKNKKSTIKIARSIRWASPTQELHPESLEFLGAFIRLK
ncbi:UNVERIFIED_ORG: HEPN domain-containing protein [Rahnella aquatilis]|uniref:HEPN domain-containing protein n=1 Tax=Rahnella sp. 2050 TaxID=3156425 RepID=UPI001B3D48AA|nr:HEPN domain-containing protein [Rahnella aquatilis]